MPTWTYRLYKDTLKDRDDKEFERIRVIEVWYDKPNGTITGFGGPGANTGFDTPELTQYADQDMGEVDGKHVFIYEPLDEKEVKNNMMFTLNAMMRAVEKPVLTNQDFAHLNETPDGVCPPLSIKKD